MTGTRFEDACPPEEAEASLTEVATELAPTAGADLLNAFVLGALTALHVLDSCEGQCIDKHFNNFCTKTMWDNDLTSIGCTTIESKHDDLISVGCASFEPHFAKYQQFMILA